MRKILIVGAGQAGLQLAHRPRCRTATTSPSSRTARREQIRDGTVMSSQCMFDAALQHERDLGLDFWDDECPPVEGISLAVPAPDGSGGKAIDFGPRASTGYAQSVDQRVKMPRWMEELEQPRRRARDRTTRRRRPRALRAARTTS